MRDWLQIVIQQVQPFVSSEDIAKGTRGRDAIARELEGTSEGIICITRENVREPWLNFEAGALSKATGEASVRTVLLDLKPADVVGPLSDFQHTELADKEDVLKFLVSINDHCDRPLDKAILEKVFEKNWPDLVSRLSEVPPRDPKSVGDNNLTSEREPRRTDKQMLGEILERVRGIERNIRLGAFPGDDASQKSTRRIYWGSDTDRHGGEDSPASRQIRLEDWIRAVGQSDGEHIHGSRPEDRPGDQSLLYRSLTEYGTSVSVNRYGRGTVVGVQTEPFAAIVDFEIPPTSNGSRMICGVKELDFIRDDVVRGRQLSE